MRDTVMLLPCNKSTCIIQKVLVSSDIQIFAIGMLFHESVPILQHTLPFWVSYNDKFPSLKIAGTWGISPCLYDSLYNLVW